MNADQNQAKRKLNSIVLAALLLFFLNTVGFAQGGSIKGKVVADIPDQRKALPGVSVTLSGERLGDKKLETVSDADGEYSFPGLIAGDYVVTVEFSGFKK